MRRKRCFLPEEIYFVTIRTVEERFALDPYACPNAWLFAEGRQLDFDEKLAMRKRGFACVEQTEALTDKIAQFEQGTKPRPVVPYNTFTDSIPNIIGSCMARGIELFDVHVYGFVWMSNHGHLLLGAPPDKFADFMAYLNGQIAVNVNRFLGRKHQLWGRRYAAAQVLDEAAELERLGYLLANPQNAGIANTIDDWLGLSSASFFFHNHDQRFLRFDRTSWHAKGCPDDIGPFLSTIMLKQRLLPQLSRLTTQKMRRKVRKSIKNKVKQMPISDIKVDLDPAHAIRRRLIARTVIPTDRPESSKSNPRKRSPQPLCHTTIPSLGKRYKEWYGAFRIAYEKCSNEYRQGNTEVEFPPGSFAPSKYPLARYAANPDADPVLPPTRRNLEIADALASLFA